MRSVAPALRSVAWGVRRMVHRHSVISSAKPPDNEGAVYNESASHYDDNSNDEYDINTRAPLGTVRARRDVVHLPSAETPVDSGAVGHRTGRMGCGIDGVVAVTLPPAPWTLSVAGMDAELSPARVRHAPKVRTSSATPRQATFGSSRGGANDSSRRSLQGMLPIEQGRQDGAGYEAAGVGWGGVRRGARRVGTRHEGWVRAVDIEGRGMVAVPPFPPEVNNQA